MTLSGIPCWWPDLGLSPQEKRDVEGLLVPPTKQFCEKAQTVLSNLSQAIPSFMVPSGVIATSALPRTTGKLHRRELREKACKMSRKELLVYSRNEVVHQNPVTEQEITLQRVCAEMLGLPLGAIGMQANFFDLGGNSRIARQLMTQARKSNLHLTVSDVISVHTCSVPSKQQRERSSGARRCGHGPVSGHANRQSC